MKTVLTFIFILFAVICLKAQPSEETQKEAINKLNWIVGDWEGIAITQMGPGQSDTTIMHESIAKKLDGTILQVSGIGYASEEKQQIQHNAMAVISFDPYNKKYRWHSWRVPGGYFTEYSPEVGDNELHWGMETPRGKMRYKVTLNEMDQWTEIGEFSADGENWNQFLKMVLTKK